MTCGKCSSLQGLVTLLLQLQRFLKLIPGETSTLHVEPPVDVPATSGQYSVDRTRHDERSCGLSRFGVQVPAWLVETVQAEFCRSWADDCLSRRNPRTFYVMLRPSLERPCRQTETTASAAFGVGFSRVSITCGHGRNIILEWSIHLPASASCPR